MGIDYNIIGGTVCNQQRLYDHPELAWLDVAFVHCIGRALSRNMEEFFHDCEKAMMSLPEEEQATIYFYPPFATCCDECSEPDYREECLETPYGSPPPEIDIEAFLLRTEEEEDWRIRAVRDTVSHYMEQWKLNCRDPENFRFALFLFHT